MQKTPKKPKKNLELTLKKIKNKMILVWFPIIYKILGDISMPDLHLEMQIHALMPFTLVPLF